MLSEITPDEFKIGGKNWLIRGKNCFLLYKTIFLTS